MLTALMVQGAMKSLAQREKSCAHILCGVEKMEVRSQTAVSAVWSSRSDCIGNREQARFESSSEMHHLGKLRLGGQETGKVKEGRNLKNR